MVDKKGTEIITGSEITIKGVVTAVVGPKIYVDIPSDLENGHTERVTLSNNHFLVDTPPVVGKKEKT